MRPAVAADAPSVRALVRAAYAKWIPRIGREPRPMTADYERAIREHELTLLFVDGELAALLELVPHADHVFIENVAVLPERQGQGLGRPGTALRGRRDSRAIHMSKRLET